MFNIVFKEKGLHGLSQTNLIRHGVHCLAFTVTKRLIFHIKFNSDDIQRNFFLIFF